MDAEAQDVSMLRNIKTVLSQRKFMMLAIATFIREPMTPDANSGADGLILIGNSGGTLDLAKIGAHWGIRRLVAPLCPPCSRRPLRRSFQARGGVEYVAGEGGCYPLHHEV